MQLRKKLNISILSLIFVFALIIFSGCGLTTPYANDSNDKEVSVILNFDGGKLEIDNQIYEDTTEINYTIGSDNPIFTDKITPEKDGYMFEGWYLNEELTSKYTKSYVPENDSLSIYAKFVNFFVLNGDNFKDVFKCSIRHDFEYQKLYGSITPKYNIIDDESPEEIKIDISYYYLNGQNISKSGNKTFSLLKRNGYSLEIDGASFWIDAFVRYTSTSYSITLPYYLYENGIAFNIYPGEIVIPKHQVTLNFDGGILNFNETEYQNSFNYEFYDNTDNLILSNGLIPTKSGGIFDGWFLDSDYSIPYTQESETEKEFSLFAKFVDHVTINTENFDKYFSVDLTHDFSTQTLRGSIYSSEYNFDSENSPSSITVYLTVIYKNNNQNSATGTSSITLYKRDNKRFGASINQHFDCPSVLGLSWITYTNIEYKITLRTEYDLYL